MSQAATVVDFTPDGATVGAAVNAALDALKTVHSGPTAPTTPVAYMLWADTTSGLLKQRNAANTAWGALGPLGGLVRNHAAGLRLRVDDGALTQCVVTADAAYIGGAYYAGVNLTLSTANAAGTANAITSGQAWATNQWSAVYLCGADDGSAACLVAVPDGASLTLPTGYARSLYVGDIRTSSGTATNLRPLEQLGPRAWWRESDSSHRPLAYGVPASGWTDINLASDVPPGILAALVAPYLEGTASADAGDLCALGLRKNGTTPSTGRDVCHVKGPNQAATSEVEVGCDASRVIEYLATVSGTTALGDLRVRLDVVGWINHRVA